MKNMPILLKRETWEHNSFWVVPAVLMAIILLSALAGLLHGVGGEIGFNSFVSHLSNVPELGRSHAIYGLFLSISLLFSMVMTFVIFFYLLDALYSERKERHILFWKSLPVSDTETVLSKVLTASVVIPVFFLIGALVTKIVFLMLSTIFIWVGGGSAFDLIWKPAPIFSDILSSLYYIIVAGFWMLPFTGWLLLSSSLAKKARPFMWAVLVPIFIIIVEQNVTGGFGFAETLGNYLTSFWDTAFHQDIFSGSINFDSKSFTTTDLERITELNEVLNPMGVLSSLKFWVGQIIGVIFIAAAIYLRRYRDDS